MITCLSLYSVDFIDVNNLIGCGDWTEDCALECINEGGPIPRLVHFLKLDGGNFTLREWLSIMSARKFIKPERIIVYSMIPIPDGCWWQRTLPFVEHHILPSEAFLKSVNGIQVQHLAHQSDFIRNSLLYHIGGVYSDTDMIMVKSFDDLLDNHQVVVSREDSGYIGSALILARRNSCFMCTHAKRACQNYDGWWDSHATVTLHQIVVEFKGYLRGFLVFPDYMHGFFPYGGSFWHQPYLYETSMTDLRFNLSQVYSVHLFNHVSAVNQKKYLQHYDWIVSSPTPVAAAIRNMLPPWFNAAYFDDTECIDLPKEELTRPTPPMFVLEGSFTPPTTIYKTSRSLSLILPLRSLIFLKEIVPWVCGFLIMLVILIAVTKLKLH